MSVLLIPGGAVAAGTPLTCDGLPATWVGRAGNDVFRGTAGMDVVVDLSGNAFIQTGAGDDHVCTGPGNHVIDTGDGADSVTDAGGINGISSGNGNDTVASGRGPDVVLAGSGADTIIDAGGTNLIASGSGDDVVTTGAGNDIIDAGDGSDAVQAGAGVNKIKGGNGGDSITSGPGNDSLDGGAGFDVCTPSGGTDRLKSCEDVRGPLPTLGADPTNAPAGGLISLVLPAGFEPVGELSLLIGNQTAPVVRDESGALSAGVPLFLNPATKWPAPPAGRVDVILLADGVAVAAGFGVLQVTPLTPAPGSAGQAQNALAEIVDAWQRLGAEFADDLVDQPGAQEQWFSALSQALDDQVSGDGPDSLASLLASADPATLALLDAWFAQSGVQALLEEYAAAISAAADALEAGNQALAVAQLTSALSTAGTPMASVGTWDVAPSPATSQASTSYLSDIALSLKMQLYETVKLFGEQVIGATATTWSMGGGILAMIGREVPLAAAVGVVLSLLDFGVNKMLVGLLPASIESFDLTLGSTQLERGDTTNAVLKVTAVNAPPGIGVQDFIGLALNALGLGTSGQNANAARQALLERYNALMGALQGFLSNYAQLHPELNLDTTVAQIPALRWESTVTSISLVERLSSTPDVINGLAGEVDWQADQTECGAGRIFARTIVGKWGDDVLDSNVVTVDVECVAVTVSPGFVSLPPLGRQQFTASVTGATDPSVTWTSNDCCITSEGIYTAPATPGTYTVTATSNEDPGQSNSATVLVEEQITVAISPQAASVGPGGTVQFAATVAGTSNTAVSWSATGGTISQTGLFTAGSTPGTFAVSATSAEDPTKSATASITVASQGVSRVSSRGQALVMGFEEATRLQLPNCFQDRRSPAAATGWTSGLASCSTGLGENRVVTTARLTFTEEYVDGNLVAVSASGDATASAAGAWGASSQILYSIRFRVLQTTVLSVDAAIEVVGTALVTLAISVPGGVLLHSPGSFNQTLTLGPGLYDIALLVQPTADQPGTENQSSSGLIRLTAEFGT